MVRRLDLTTWKRRQHFHFFRTFDHPFFNICAEVDVTTLLAGCRKPGGPSFFAATLYCSMLAINEIEEFHYRLDGDGVVVHEVVHAGTTVLMPDGTFSLGYFEWDPDFDRFVASTREEIERIRRGPTTLEPRFDQTDVVHSTVIPWVSLTGFAHARRHDPTDSVPKMVFGRYHLVEGRQRMPVSIEVHHALMDGLQVGRFFELFGEYLAREGSRLGQGGSQR